ncbi:MAG: hypothetical protein ASARMPRED_005011 [Alectoria sarmentosa]|nr:MAG: hypothetical protein ASARMPRED_005011 [Alectoria sarmentosa]
MEPLSALVIASTVVQMVDFGAKLFSKSVELYKSAESSLPTNVELSSIVEDLSQISASLAATGILKNEELTEDEVALNKLASRCNILANELISDLLRLAVQNPQRKWESVYKAVKAVWKEKKIHEIQERLNAFRSELTLRLVAILNNQQSTVLKTLKDLDDEHDRLNINSSNKMDEVRQDILLSICQVQQSMDEHKTKRGSQALQGQKQPLSKHQKKKKSRLQEKGKENSIQLGTNLSDTLLDLRDEGYRLHSEQNVLNSLYFEMLPTRHGRISFAHHRTFDWLLNEDQKDAPFDPKFREWLERKQGVYWIAGNAGSGKSTLMKFLADNNPLVLQALKKWSDSKRLVTASHYFWNAGTTMQKSPEGLLRSLLYDVLRQCPDLMPLMLPSRWNPAMLHGTRSPWNIQELLHAFTQLSTQTVDSARFCFFVDGLDECAGEHVEIISVLSSLATSETIKVCLSSRPWNIFENAFGKSTDRKLLLQDFNAPDIKLYVKDMFESNDQYLQLKVQDNRYEGLAKEIVGKAQGVFLWVFLVVRSLRRGLTNADTLLVLQTRLRQFPTDLKEFYLQMVGNIEDIYHEQMAQTLHIALSLSEPSPVLLYCFLDEADEAYAERPETKPWDVPEIFSQCKVMGRRLNARCAGLIEPFRDRWVKNPIFKYKVDFLHRTARDFLLGQDMPELLARRMQTPFDVRAYLCRALLALFKLACLEPNSRMLLDHLDRTVSRITGHVHEIENPRRTTECSLLDAARLNTLLEQRRKAMRSSGLDTSKLLRPPEEYFTDEA